MIPTTAITRMDLSVGYSQFSLLANRGGFIGPQVLTPVPVSEQSSSFPKVTIASVLGKVEDTVRASDGTYKRDDFEWTTDSYSTKEHGVEETVDDRLIAMYGSIIRAEIIKTMRAINRVLQAYESEVAAAVFNTTTWTGAALTTTVSTAWTTPATAAPIDDVLAAMDKVEAGCGQSPNTLILTKYAFRKMMRCAQVVDLIKYSGRDDPKTLATIRQGRAALQELFEIENVLIANGFKNTANEGATPSLSRMWDQTMAMVCHVNNDMDLSSPEPCIGHTCMFGEENASIASDGENAPGIIVEEYREEARRGGVIRARNDYQLKILHPEAGHLLQGVTA